MDYPNMVRTSVDTRTPLSGYRFRKIVEKYGQEDGASG